MPPVGSRRFGRLLEQLLGARHVALHQGQASGHAREPLGTRVRPRAVGAFQRTQRARHRRVELAGLVLHQAQGLEACGHGRRKPRQLALGDLVENLRFELGASRAPRVGIREHAEQGHLQGKPLRGRELGGVLLSEARQARGLFAGEDPDRVTAARQRGARRELVISAQSGVVGDLAPGGVPIVRVALRQDPGDLQVDEPPARLRERPVSALANQVVREIVAGPAGAFGDDQDAVLFEIPHSREQVAR